LAAWGDNLGQSGLNLSNGINAAVIAEQPVQGQFHGGFMNSSFPRNADIFGFLAFACADIPGSIQMVEKRGKTWPVWKR
jgi:hypothetical protein